MKAMILAGGRGKRLRPLTDKLPKPMMPIMNRPIMEHLIQYLSRHGITEIGVTLGDDTDAIERYFGSGRQWGVSITYYYETTPLGTAGGLRNARDFLTEDFVLVHGDVITAVDLSSVIQFHKDRNALVTLVLKESSPAAEARTKILRLADKAVWKKAKESTVCTGIYVMKHEVLACLPHGQALDLTHELLPALAEENKALFGYVTTDYSCNITDISAYRQCHKDVFLKKIDLSLPEAALKSGILIGKNCTISKTAVIKPYSVIGNDCVIGDNTDIQNAIIWSGSTLPPNAEIFRTVCYGVQSIPFAVIGHNRQNRSPSLLHNRFEGMINDTVTPEFIIRLMLAVGSALPKDAKILLSCTDHKDCMMIKFAMLTGIMAGGSKAYNLVDCGDRSLAKFALRKLCMDAGIHAELTSKGLMLEILDADGTPMCQDTMNRIRVALAADTAHRHAALKEIKTPVNVNSMPVYYFKDLLLTTICKRLNFSVVICCAQAEIRSRFKKICTAFGMSAIFTNEVSLVPGLITKNQFDLGLSVDDSENYTLYDENGEMVSTDTFYAFVTLIVASAFKGAEVMIPRHASDSSLQVAPACRASVRRTAEENFEATLLRQNTKAAALEYDLCFDPIRCLIRICEFLYLNNLTLGQTKLYLPQFQKPAGRVNFTL